ncbi:oxygen-dependent protoporphyrinogen oxidase [Microbacterium sp. AK009]|uniref:protoporphyrinogen/coproporphyrinogen oxidase n=1 Tax=Microbacterium sp. AK009 TaxID=2723068 RepID=UPI0015C71BF3|nr:FAD-dependent oxidoreductase [Microbacterium sp. AK009]NYF17449.1 oxygen-dependent protoporphyrinogen oxidase [Microbacterium sp. AK009]
MTADLLVVGGGVAGLVFARRAALAGLRVRLFEAESVFGGQVSRQDVAGVALDAGAESFATRGGDGPGTVLALLGELGLAGDIVAPAAGSPAWVQERSDRAFPLPAAGLLGIPTILDESLLPALGASGLARARQDAILPPEEGASADTLGALVRARMGDRVVDALVAPVVRGVHSTTPDALPIDSASPRLREEFRRTGSLAAAVASIRSTSPAGSQVAGVRGGVFRLVDALVTDAAAHGAELTAGARVTAVADDGIEVGGRRLRGIPILARPRRAPDPHRRITVVTLVVEAAAWRDAPRGTGVLVGPDVQGVRARALTHLTAKWPWIRESLGQREAVRLSYDGSAAPDAVAAAVRDAEALLGAPVEALLDHTVRTWDRWGRADPEDPVLAVGEERAGTGLSAVVRQAEALATSLTVERASGHSSAERGRMEG